MTRPYNARLPKTRAPLAERLMRGVVVDQDTQCWEWQGSTSNGGYGLINKSGRNSYTHRVSYELFVGPIPDGLELDHLCRNRICCNPLHLEPVTTRENQHRSPITNATKTHCPSGHPYDEANTYLWRGKRYCRACNRERSRIYNPLRKEKRARKLAEQSARAALAEVAS